MKELVKEVCVESFQEALVVAASGATRIELCDNLAVGGTTPSYGTIKKVINELTVPVMVMIRPRGGDFCYSPEEFDIMRDDLLICRELGVVGVVFGLLNPDQTIDIERTKELVELARPMEVTFHKAIDDSIDILLSIKKLKNIGIDRVLTSGGKPTALEGCETLLKMIEIAGDELNIIVAGKVTWENFEEIRQSIPSKEYHGRRLVEY
jgi:copper homeostasis protein